MNDRTVGGVGTVELRAVLAAGRGDIRDFGAPVTRAWARPPDLLVGEVTRDLMQAYYGDTHVLGTGVFRVRGAEVAGEGHLLVDGAVAVCGQLNTGLDDALSRDAALPARLAGLPRRGVEGEVVLLTGAGFEVYGHWLVDYLPKLYLLHRAGYRPARLRYLLPADTPAFARDWLRLLGIGDDRIVPYDRWHERVAPRTLIVPTDLRYGSRASPMLRPARDFLLGALPRGVGAGVGGRGFGLGRRPSARTRLFVARAETAASHNRRRLLQREAFAAQARARGFAVVRPETLSIPDQIALFRGAGAICGEYGSGLHGSLFAPEGAAVLAVRDNGRALGFLQSSLDHVLGHAAGYVIGGPRDAQGDFSASEADLGTGLDWLDAAGARHG